MKHIAAATVVVAALAAVALGLDLTYTRLLTTSPAGADAVVVHAADDGLAVANVATPNVAFAPAGVYTFDCSSDPCTQVQAITSVARAVVGDADSFVAINGSNFHVFTCVSATCTLQSTTAAVNLTGDAAYAFEAATGRVVISRYNGTAPLSELYDCSGATGGAACTLVDTPSFNDFMANGGLGAPFAAQALLLDGDLLIASNPTIYVQRGGVLFYSCAAVPCVYAASAYADWSFRGMNFGYSLDWLRNADQTGTLVVGAPNEAAVGGYRGAVHIFTIDLANFTASPPGVAFAQSQRLVGPAIDGGLQNKPGFAHTVKLIPASADVGVLAVGAPYFNNSYGIVQTHTCYFAYHVCNSNSDSLELPDATFAYAFSADGFGSAVHFTATWFVGNSFTSSWIARPAARVVTTAPAAAAAAALPVHAHAQSMGTSFIRGPVRHE